jgi:DNA-binding NarL/FixJ family response regulator
MSRRRLEDDEVATERALVALSEGERQKKIADELHLSHQALRTRLSREMRRRGARTMCQLMYLYGRFDRKARA